MRNIVAQGDEDRCPSCGRGSPDFKLVLGMWACACGWIERARRRYVSVAERLFAERNRN